MRISVRMFVLTLLIPAAGALAQNPVQWHGNARAAVERAREQQLPVLFWVTQGKDLDDDELRDAQEESFRDPTVVAIAEHHFVPVRVSRNSRVLEEAEKLGLPTAHGLYVALVTSDGRLLEQIDPGQVASPEALAERLTAAFRSYRDSLYQDKLRQAITAPEAPKPEVRRAVQTVWRLNILSADRDIVALLDRKDVLPIERQRLYSLLASFATAPAVEALLSRAAAGERDAALALGKAEAGALEFLLARLPDGQSATPAQIAAYDGAAQIARVPGRRPAAFWSTATPEARAKVLDALRARAATVLEYWQERSGRWR